MPLLDNLVTHQGTDLSVWCDCAHARMLMHEGGDNQTVERSVQLTCQCRWRHYGFPNGKFSNWRAARYLIKVWCSDILFRTHHYSTNVEFRNGPLISSLLRPLDRIYICQQLFLLHARSFVHACNNAEHFSCVPQCLSTLFQSGMFEFQSVCLLRSYATFHLNTPGICPLWYCELTLLLL